MSTATAKVFEISNAPEKPKAGPRIRGVFERSPGEWWVRYTDNGRRHREKAGTKVAAILLVQKRRMEVLQHKKLPELRRAITTFAQIADAAVLDVQQYRPRATDAVKHLRRAVEWFGCRDAGTLTAGDISQRLNTEAVAHDWAASTYNHHLNAISVAYKLAIEAEKVSLNPARQVRRRRETVVRTGFINDAQYHTLIQHCDSLWLRAMLGLGYTYGWCAGELVGLRVAQVDMQARTVRLEPSQTKNREPRVIRLTGECYELVSACIAGKAPCDTIFTYEDGLPVKAYRFAWERLCVRAGLGRFVCKLCNTEGGPMSATGRMCPKCSKAKRRGVLCYSGLLFHDLRRSAVRNLERAGVPRSVAMKVTGHRTEAVYRRYAIVSESDLSEAVDRLELTRQRPPERPPATQADKEVLLKVQ